MSPKQTIAVALIAAAAVIAAAAAAALPRQNSSNDNQATTSFAEDNNARSANKSLTIVSISGSSLVGGSKFLITPNPFTGDDGNSSNYIVSDGDPDDRNLAPGIVMITGLQEGNFTVVQLDVPSGYTRDRLPKTVELSDKNSSAATTFSSVNASSLGSSGQEAENAFDLRSIVYTAKFECGTIRGDEGPLRPGHYDTDIGIFNKQEFPLKITWIATTNDGRSTNSILKTLQPQTSTGIVCKDLRTAFGDEEARQFVEGFVLIQVLLDPGTLGSLSGGSGVAITGRTSAGEIDLLEVQVFYTANALDELPHEVLVDKITFVIIEDKSGKIPESMLSKMLDITVPAEINEISNPEAKVKRALSEKYGLSSAELSGLRLEIRGVSIGVGTMIDDHAISLSRLRPQPSG